MNKHGLKNMIYNLENKNGLEWVEFTEKAATEVLGYLKELEKQLDKPEAEECEFKETFLLEEYYCTKCEKHLTKKTFRIINANYCPNCGRKIKKGE